LNVDKELDERTSSDRVFQTRAAAIGKARSPTVDSRCMYISYTCNGSMENDAVCLMSFLSRSLCQR